MPAVVASACLGPWAGGAQRFSKDGIAKDIWLQNGAYVWLVPVVVTCVLIALGMKNHPARGNFGEQFQVLKKKHAWVTTVLYTMTFGTFSGMAGAFPTLIREVFGKVADAPDPLTFAFIGPLVGALARPLGGVLSDKFTGGRVTAVVAATLVAATLGILPFTAPTSRADFAPFLVLMLVIFAAAGFGNASVFKQIAMIFPPKEAAPVLGFSAAVAVLAFGFFVPILLGRAIAATGSPNAAFIGFAAFYAVCLGLNWFHYARRGAETPC